MLLKCILLICSMLAFGCGIHPARAGDELTLEVIASSQSHTEVLVIRHSGDEVTWDYVVPIQKRSGKGRLSVDPSSMREAFELVRNQQNDLDQRQRVKDMSPTTTTFSLLFADKEGLQISMPLTHREQQLILRTELMKMVLKEINAQHLFLKAIPMVDFFYPNSISNERKIETDSTDSR